MHCEQVVIAGIMFLQYIYLRRQRAVYLVDFEMFEASRALYCPPERFMSHSKFTGFFDEQALEFQERLLARSGVGPQASFPQGIYDLDMSLESARAEAELVLGTALESLMKKTNLRANDIDILIVNCSLFNPTPSLASVRFAITLP